MRNHCPFECMLEGLAEGLAEILVQPIVIHRMPPLFCFPDARTLKRRESNASAKTEQSAELHETSAEWGMLPGRTTQAAHMLVDFHPNRRVVYPQSRVWRQVFNLPNGRLGKLETCRHSQPTFRAAGPCHHIAASVRPSRSGGASSDEADWVLSACCRHQSSALSCVHRSAQVHA